MNHKFLRSLAAGVLAAAGVLSGAYAQNQGGSTAIPSVVQGSTITPAAGSPTIKPGFNCPPGQTWTTDSGYPACVGSTVASAPKPCNSRNLSWSVGGLTCTASAPVRQNGGSVALVASNGYTGNATFVCSDGLWAATGAPTCSAPACPAETLAWSSGGVGCSGPVSPVNSGGSAWVTSSNGNSGSANFACVNGYWGAPASGSCTAPPPPTNTTGAKCPGLGANITWTGNSKTCASFVSGAAMDAGTYTYTSTNGNQGSYDRRCNANGTWTDLGGTCGTAAPPPPGQCAGGTFPWTVAGVTCQAVVPVTSPGMKTVNSTNGNIGSFTARCETNGTWTPLSESCAPPTQPPVKCPSGGAYASWTGLSGETCGGYLPSSPVDPGTYTVDNVIAVSDGYYRSQCKADGTWEFRESFCSSRTVQPRCAPQQYHSWSNCYGPGAGATQDSGFAFNTTNVDPTYEGAATFTCQDDGTWKPSMASCAPAYRPQGCESPTLAWIDGEDGSRFRGEPRTSLAQPNNPGECVAYIKYEEIMGLSCGATEYTNCLLPFGVQIMLTDTTNPRIGVLPLRCTNVGGDLGKWIITGPGACTPN